MSDKTPKDKKIDLSDVTVENELTDEELKGITGGLRIGQLNKPVTAIGIDTRTADSFNTVFGGGTFDTVFAGSDFLNKGGTK